MKISVLTISFNTAKYLERAIKSVIMQGYANWEHIVMDGGSTDGTLDILKKYPHIIWASEPDKGQSDAMNKAFEKASGDLIVYLNADDAFYDGAFEAVINAYHKDANADMVVGRLDVERPHGMVTTDPQIKLKDILLFWPCRFPANPVSYFYRRELQEKVGPFPVDNHYTMDYWFLLRAYLYSKKTIKIQHILGAFYFDGNNKSSDEERSYQYLKKVRNEFLQEHPSLSYYIHIGVQTMRDRFWLWRQRFKLI